MEAAEPAPAPTQAPAAEPSPPAALEDEEEEEEEEKPAPFNADLENGGARSYGMQKVQDNGYGGTKDWSTIYMVRGGKVSCVRLEKRGVRISQWHRCQLME